MEEITKVHTKIKDQIINTSLQYNHRLSNLNRCQVYLKREDMQFSGSFKVRGIINKISGLSENEKTRGIVCASQGNFGQSVSDICEKLKINCTIFMIDSIPPQKLTRLKSSYTRLLFGGVCFDECIDIAEKYAKGKNKVFIHPYNDMDVINGYGTVALEIFEECDPDIIICPIGGGSLMSGVCLYSKDYKKSTKIIGVESDTCASMTASIEANKNIYLEYYEEFVDNASVPFKNIIPYNILKEKSDKVLIVPNGKICCEIIELYQNERIIVEPAGALSVSVFDQIENIEGLKIVCIISGGNNDLMRYPEILEKALKFKDCRRYYIIDFVQKPGQLKKFINDVLPPNIDIIRFEYLKKNNSSQGSVLLGLEGFSFTQVEINMNENNFNFILINESDSLYSYMI